MRQLLAATLFLLLAVDGAIAAERVALVIGNAAYAAPMPRLDLARNDAADMAAAFRRLGYDQVIVETDLELAGMRKALDRFRAAAAGARVAAVDRDRAAAEDAIAGLPGGPHLAVAMDLRKIDAHEAMIEGVAGAFGRLDVLVEAAAVLVRRDSIEEVTEEDWDL